MHKTSTTLASAIILAGCGSKGPADDWCVPDGHEGPYQCPSDTDSCTVGDNMIDPHMDGEFDGDANTPSLTIVWDNGTGAGRYLPSSYFDAVQVGQDAQTALVTSASYVAERSIIVNSIELSTHLQTHDTISFSLAFPDREEFIGCTHPGMKDIYLLDVHMTFDGAALTTLELEEKILLGDI